MSSLVYLCMFAILNPFFYNTSMIQRTKSNNIIQEALKRFPAIGLLGARQVGKTTLAKHLYKQYGSRAIYLDLELTSDEQKLIAPELYLRQHEDKLIIIDEIQRLPEIFPLLRALIDQKRVPGRFLLLGSAAPQLIKQTSESLAGRIIYHELHPFSIDEVGSDDYQKLWLRGGYPESYLSTDDDQSFQWREAFVRTYLERDLPQLGIQIPTAQIKRFWMMLAHSHGQIWNASSFGTALEISGHSTKHYLDILEETFMARRLQPFFTNTKKRLIKSPKVYVRDSGLVHTLKSLKTFESLQNTDFIGASWEGFVIEQIMILIPYTWKTFFYRTAAGAEIDLIIQTSNGEIIPVEIKYGVAPKLTKSFWNALSDLDFKKAFVVYMGDEIFPIKENVYFLPFKELKHIVS